MIKLINDRVSKEKLRFKCWITKISAALCVYPNNGLSLEPPGKKNRKETPSPPLGNCLRLDPPFPSAIQFPFVLSWGRYGCFLELHNAHRR